MDRIEDCKEKNHIFSHPRLRYNIVALGVLQGVNYLMPLITLPYLTRILGVDVFGKVSFVQVVMQYLIILTDYGFSWSATRKISAHRDDIQSVSSIFTSTWAAQWLLAVISGVILVTAVNNIRILRQDALLYFFGFTMVIGNVFLPIWFLQGLERMKEAAIIQVLGRLAALAPIFIYVKGPDDAMWSLLIMGIAPIISGILTIYWITQQKLIIWKVPTLTCIIEELREGGLLFISKISISLYTILTPLVLGAFSGTTVVGYFNIANKARQAGQSLLQPISQALFPRMSHLYAHDPDGAHELLKRSFVVVFSISGAVSIFLWFAADWIILILGGVEFSDAVSILRWLAFVPLLIAISNLFGVQVLLAMGLVRLINITAFTVGCITLIIMFPAIKYAGGDGAGMITLIAEFIVAFVFTAKVIKSKFFKNN